MSNIDLIISTFSQNLYPSKQFEQSYDTNTPEIFAVVVACTFVLIAVAIFVYHMFVESRNTKLVETTARSNKIVTGLFPSNVRDKLYEEEKNRIKDNSIGRLSNFMNLTDSDRGGHINKLDESRSKSDIIADHFSESTIMFAGKFPRL